VATRTFYDEIAANKRNSLLMTAFVVLLLGLLGFAIGYAILGSASGGVLVTGLALAVGAISGIGTYFSGDKLVLTVSGAKPVDAATAPQLMNVVQELAIAANLPMPAVLHHRRHGPERVRDRSRSGPRLRCHHDRSAGEARP